MANESKPRISYSISLVAIVCVLIGAVGAWQARGVKQDVLGDEIKKLHNDGSKKAQANEKAIIEIKGDVKYIKKTQDKLMETQEKQDDKLDVILEAIRK